jgi:NADH dehydrogenase [ubiquinone] 1 alpha subcomplex assembly factor 4
MGKVLSVATAKVQRFNVENRAHRFLAQEKVRPAPKFESNVKDLERVLKGNKALKPDINNPKI